MADHSAAVLADVLVADDPGPLAAALAGQLVGDPPLAVWTAYTAFHRDHRRLQSVADAAAWLAGRAAVVLQWDEPGDLALEDTARVAAFADQVAADLTLAHRAAFMPGPAAETVGWDKSAQSHRDLPRVLGDGGTALPLVYGLVAPCGLLPPCDLAVDRAYFDALLHNSLRWFALTGDWQPGPGEEPPRLEWPSAAGREASPHVAGAAAILSADGAEVANSIRRDIEASRRHGAEGRERWIEAVPGLPRWLPALAAKLARLAELQQQFQATLETEKLQSLAEFAAGAGHEINNPLAIIAGRAQLLLAGEADPERRRDLALINAQVRRAHEMIADLWLFARPPRPELQTTDLVALADRVIGELSPQAAERGVSLCRTGEPGPLVAEVDPVQVGVAIAALCKNSLEAIGRDGQIEIGLAAGATDVEIHVRDTGPGIAPDERLHIFDPFYSARQAGRGIGMGLSKCWRIVTGHGGRIAVRSEPGQGAEFVIILPRTSDKATG